MDRACTTVDTLECDDGDLCTLDSCDPSAGCVYTAQAPSVIDFESLDVGEVVMRIASVTISADGNRSSPDVAIVFDSANPERDIDLGTPNESLGGPGVGRGEGAGTGNDVALGNLLIIAENDRDRDGDGRIDAPDDNASGGTITFEFDEPVSLDSFLLLDIEELGGHVELWHFDVLVDNPDVPMLGDNSLQSMSFAHPIVTSVVVHLAGSGALDELSYCVAP